MNQRIVNCSLSVLVFVIGLSLVDGSSAQEDLKNKPPSALEKMGKRGAKQLVFEKILFKSSVRLYPTFADADKDSKPDLILGTSGGHQFEKGTGVIRRGTDEHYYQDISFHLSSTSNESIEFGRPMWPKSDDVGSHLPWG